MGWALWLAVPPIATVLAAVITWWRNRPQAPPGPAQAMRAHQRYLDALGTPARQRDRQAGQQAGQQSDQQSDQQCVHSGARIGVDKVRE